MFLQFSAACVGNRTGVDVLFALQTAQDNIDLQTTILSRFDLIFIVKDIRMFSQDKVRKNSLPSCVVQTSF